MKPDLEWIAPTVRTKIEALLVEHQIKVQTITRRGPRFIVALVRYRSKPAVFKASINPADRFMNERFGREVQFLQFAGHRGHARLRHMLPKFYAGATRPLVWYVREFVAGKNYDVNGGNIIFQPAFFSPLMLQQITGALHALHTVRPAQLTPALRKSFVVYDTIADKLAFLQSKAPCSALVRELGRAAVDKLFQHLRQQRQVYDNAPGVLTHHEMFPPHFYTRRGRLQIIDWENITWANPVRDWVTLWMRSSRYPAWQSALKEAARKETRVWTKETFDQVWDAAVLIDALYVLTSLATYPIRGQIKEIGRFSHQIVRTQLKRMKA